MTNQQMKKRLWASIGVCTVLCIVLMFLLDLVLPTITPGYTAELQEITWTGDEGIIVIQDASGQKEVSDMVLRPNGEQLLTHIGDLEYKEIAPAIYGFELYDYSQQDGPVAATGTSNGGQLEVLFELQAYHVYSTDSMGMEEIPLPDEPLYNITFSSLSTDERYLLLQTTNHIRLDGGTKLIPQIWVYDRQEEVWSAVHNSIKLQEAIYDYWYVEWYNEESTLALKTRNIKSNHQGKTKVKKRFAWNSQEQQLYEIEDFPSLKKTRQLHQLYSFAYPGDTGDIYMAPAPVLGIDSSAYLTRPFVGPARLIWQEYNEAEPQELLRWWQMRWWTDARVRFFPDGETLLVIVNNEIGVYRIDTNQFAPLDFDRDDSSSSQLFSDFTIEILP